MMICSDFALRQCLALRHCMHLSHIYISQTFLG